MNLIQLSFLVPVAEVEQVRAVAREYFGVPPEVVITREDFGFGDYVEFKLGPADGPQTHFFCSDTYRHGTEQNQAEHFRAFLATKGLACLTPIEGDPRPLLASMGLVLKERLPEHPPEILGIDR